MNDLRLIPAVFRQITLEVVCANKLFLVSLLFLASLFMFFSFRFGRLDIFPVCLDLALKVLKSYPLFAELDIQFCDDFFNSLYVAPMFLMSSHTFFTIRRQTGNLSNFLYRWKLRSNQMTQLAYRKRATNAGIDAFKMALPHVH